MRREETVPEKARKVAAEMTETQEPSRDIPEGGRTFLEHVSEYVGRLWGSAKNVVGQGTEATGRKAEEAKNYGSRNVEDTKEAASSAFGSAKDGAKENKKAIAEGAKDAKEEFVGIGVNVKENVSGSK